MNPTMNPTANHRHLAARLIAIAWLALLQGLLPLLHAHPQGPRATGEGAPIGLHLPDRQSLVEGGTSGARPAPTITAQDDRSRLADDPPAAPAPGQAGLLARVRDDAGIPPRARDHTPPPPAPRACARPPRGPPAAA